MRLQGKLSILVLLVLAGCGGPGGKSPTDPNLGTGQFIDSAVEGLEYQSGNVSGLTSSDGSFQYEQGSSIRFFIGDIVLGEGTPSDVMSPLDIVAGASGVTDDQVLNIARFLQTLDTDNDSSNGITISAFVREQAIGKTIDFNMSTADFTANGEVQVIVSELTASNNGGPQLLVSPEDAEAHLRESLGLDPMPEPGPNLSMEYLQAVCRPPVTEVIIAIATDDGIIVEFNDSVYEEEVDALVASHGLTWESHFPVGEGVKWGVVLVPGFYLLEGIRLFETLCLVNYVEINLSVPVGDGTSGGAGDGFFNY